MVYEPHFQPCPYRTVNNHCVNKKVKGKHCGYKRVELCEIYNVWVKSKKIDFTTKSNMVENVEP